MNATFSQFIIHIIRNELFIAEPARIGYPDGTGQFPNEQELLKAHLLVELIERYRYPLEALTVDALVPVGGQEVSYAHVDILVRNRPGNPVMLVMVEPIDTYEQKLEEIMQRLFVIAVLLRMRKKTPPMCLLYYTRWYEGATRKIRHTAVDYTTYQTHKAWNKANRPSLSEIPHNP
jgi:hypothetical protein